MLLSLSRGLLTAAAGATRQSTAGHLTAAAPASFSTWLPAAVTRLIKKRQRGQANYAAAPLQPGRISPTRPVPPHISRPHYAAARATAAGGSKGPGLSKLPEVMSDQHSRDAMRAAGQLAARALQLAGSMAVPGTTTDDIDAAVHAFLIQAGAYPSPLHYHGFPKSVCTSVNEVVCHGVPDDRPLREGDLVNVDVTAYLGGFHGDTNATFCIGRYVLRPTSLAWVGAYGAWEQEGRVRKGGRGHTGGEREWCVAVTAWRRARGSGVLL